MELPSRISSFHVILDYVWLNHETEQKIFKYNFEKDKNNRFVTGQLKGVWGGDNSTNADRAQDLPRNKYMAHTISLRFSQYEIGENNQRKRAVNFEPSFIAPATSQSM